jgi:hypothetical protein
MIGLTRPPGSHAQVATMSAVIAAGTFVAALAVAWLGNFRLRQVSDRGQRGLPFG